jgi:molybdate transport system substrate-binding protein
MFGTYSRTAASAASVVALLALAGAASATPSRATGGLTVFAAASLTDVLPAIDGAPAYSFGGSNALATQIANGAPADVFASANSSIPAALYQQGLVEKPITFTRNSLVIVVPKSNPAGIHSVYDLTKPGVKLVVANSGVPVGSYTLQILNQMALSSVLDNVVSEETDVRSVLSKVQLGQADAGFVYSTDAETEPGQVTVVKLPAWAQPKVTYAMAIVSRSPNKAAAQAFIDKVLGRQGQAVMQQYGFLPASAPVPTITKLTPRKARPGTQVIVIGSNFGSTTSVTFRGIPARFKVVSNGRLKVTVPAKAKSGTLTVTNPSGTATWKSIKIKTIKTIRA